MQEKDSYSIKEFVGKLHLGPKQSFKNMDVIPVFFVGGHRAEYISLKQAMDLGEVKIVEKNQSGTVSELFVINNGDQRVLLIDGEELLGAKQNRILNTSILLKPHSEVLIPVSCTEQGRWSYESPEFRESDVFASHRIRRDKSRSVSENLKYNMEFRSDQGEVWGNVEDLLRESGAYSHTSAMKDVFKQPPRELSEYLHSFRMKEGQQGVIVLINGEIAGFDYVSSPRVFADIYNKLIKSYAMEARIANGRESENRLSLENFLYKLAKSKAYRYKSIGHGYDIRFEDRQVRGNALEYHDEVIQLSAFLESNKRQRFMPGNLNLDFM